MITYVYSDSPSYIKSVSTAVSYNLWNSYELKPSIEFHPVFHFLTSSPQVTTLIELSHLFDAQLHSTKPTNLS